LGRTGGSLHEAATFAAIATFAGFLLARFWLPGFFLAAMLTHPSATSIRAE
jgi:hypothetical protein